jgi:hypothetical protein
VVLALLQQMLSRAQSDAATARQAALNEGASEQMSTFQRAMQFERRAVSQPPQQAVTTLWRVVQEYDQSRMEARNRPAPIPPKTNVQEQPTPPPAAQAPPNNPSTATVPAEQPTTTGKTSPRREPSPSPPAAAANPSPAELQRRDDEAKVRSTIRAYEAAYSSRDLAAVARLWPAQRNSARQTFDLLNSVVLTISEGGIRIDNNVATVPCQLRYQYNWKRAGLQRESSASVTLTLRRSGDTWIIQ